ncbi:MAG: hypothetical protein M3430_12145 [Acidobacteriota bacterium]|nr:hypothetical protein [Acidobacteriota bacterium]
MGEKTEAKYDPTSKHERARSAPTVVDTSFSDVDAMRYLPIDMPHGGEACLGSINRGQHERTLRQMRKV